MHRSVRHLLQPSKAFIKSVSPEAQIVRFAPGSFFYNADRACMSEFWLTLQELVGLQL